MTPSDFENYPTGDLCNADGRVRALSAMIKPLLPGLRVTGTASIPSGQKGAIHGAAHSAAKGETSERLGPFGDLLVDGCIAKGMAVAVFVCTIRNSVDIAVGVLTKVATIAASKEKIRAWKHGSETTSDLFELGR